MMTWTVLITEAHQPWSQALCRYFAQQQWKVIACMTEESCANISFTGQDQIRVVPLDVRSKASVQAAAERVQGMTDHIDLIIGQGAYDEEGELPGIAAVSPSRLMEAFNANALGPIRIVEAFLPMMTQGMKRIALLTNPKGSMGLSLPESGFGYGMSKAALHMAFTMMHGDLRRDGFTFRLYASALEEGENSAQTAFYYFTQPREDEERIVILHETGAELPL